MVSLQSTGALERRMEVEVPAARVEQAVDERLRDVSRTARLKGFRPGKVPLKVVRQKFGKEIHTEVVRELLQSSFAEAVTEQKLNPAGGPRIEPISVAEGQNLKYAAVFEVFPEITLQGLDAISIERPVASVTEADIDDMIETLRKQRPNWKPVTRPSRKDDRVTIDFNGTLDGVAFEGGKGDNVRIVIGEGRMLPDFEAGLVGVQADTDTTVNLRFPDDYHAKALAGKTAVFAVRVKEVAEAETPPLDEEFFKAYGVTEGGIGKLRGEVGDNLRRELEQNIRARIKSQVLDKLHAANPVDLPGSIVEQQIRELQIETARRMGIRDAAQIPAREHFVDNARRRVALGLLVNEVVKSARLEVDRARVNARLDEMISTYSDPAEARRAYLQNHEAMHQIEALVLEDQVVDWLLARARVSDRSATFKELLQPGT